MISKGTQKYLKDLQKANDKALPAALNRVAQQGRSPVIKEIQTLYNVKRGAFNSKSSGISVIRANERKLQAGLLGVGKGVSLKYFYARQTSEGVTVEIFKGKRKLIPGTFGPRIERLGGNVFERTDKTRFPIKKKYGPGTAFMMRNPRVENVFYNYVNQNFDRIFDGQLKRFWKK